MSRMWFFTMGNYMVWMVEIPNIWPYFHRHLSNHNRTGNKKEEEHEILSKKAIKAIKEAESDCPHCAFAQKSVHKQCQECGKNL